MFSVVDLRENQAASAVFPTFKSVNSSLYRSRNKHYPAVVHSLEELDIPDSLSRTHNNDDFLLHLSEDKNIIMLGTIENLRR